LAQKHNYIDLASELRYKGLSIIPVIDKAPRIRDWQNKLGEEILKPEYKAYWKNANGIGLLTGEASGIICLDIDILESTEKLKEIKAELLSMLPPLYCGLTGNPEKPPARLFKYNGEKSVKFKAIDVELLSNGNQKVLPPSMHPTTKKTYDWVNHSLFDIDTDDLPDLPENILDFLSNKNDEFKFVANTKVLKNDLTPADGRCKHGFHNLISSHCLRLFYQGWSLDDMVSDCLRLDAETNRGEKDVLYFICPTRKEFRSDIPELNAQKFVLDLMLRNNYKRHDNTDFFKDELTNGFTLKTFDKKGNSKYVRQYISLYNFLKIRCDACYIPEMKSFQIYDGKKYSPEPDDFIKRFAQKNFKKPSCISIGEKNTFLDFAKNEQQSKGKEFTLNDKGLVNLKNGVLNIKQNKLKPHNKKYKMPYVIDVPYLENNDSPVWETFLDLITLSRPHMALVIEEFIGYCISACSYNRFNNLLILDGEGSNGKSTLIRIITELLGEENTSSVSLEAINNERFAGFSLVNKLVNFCAEEPRESFSNTGAIKKLTGGDPVMVEEKHKGAFQYNNLAKLIISYNKMPFFPDDSIGMRRRIILIPCDQNFEDHPELKIKDVEARIFATELPQVLYRCIEAFRGVIERGAFTSIPEGIKRVEKMIIDSNPVLEFIDEYVEISGSDNDFESSNNVYMKFKNFTGEHSKYTKNSFAKKIKHELMKNKNVKYLKTPVRGYLGVKLDPT